MTELEWCRENAPDSLKNADEEILLSIYKDVDIHKPLFSEVFERLSVLVSRCKSVNRNVIWDCALKDFRRC